MKGRVAEKGDGKVELDGSDIVRRMERYEVFWFGSLKGWRWPLCGNGAIFIS